MRFSDIIKGVARVAIEGREDVEVASLTYVSRQV